MSQDDPLKVLHTAVNCYLTTLQTVADSLALACPPIGGPYRYRLSRLRTRLAFDASPEALEESCSIAETEIQEYARKAGAFVDRHGVELRRGAGGVEDLVEKLSQRQNFYDSRLRQFAKEMESTAYPAELDRLAEVVALQATGLMQCVESMSRELQALLASMREEITQVNQRMLEIELTDPATGLMNRREMERRIAERKSQGETPPLLVFDLLVDLPADIAKQVATRLASQLRYQDLICRWTSRQFLVMFQGVPETAEARAEQILPWIAGRYLRDNGSRLELNAQFRMVGPDIVDTPETKASAPSFVL
jgi:GGDEF domain-containing protein